MHFIEKIEHFVAFRDKILIFITPKPTNVSNLRVSCRKISMYIFILAIILACSNDLDILTDAVINDGVAAVEERGNSDAEHEEEEEQGAPPETTEEEGEIEDGFVSSNTQFPPIEDAYVQSNKGYDQTIIRLDENNRTSYLKFDLSPIAEIGGYITAAILQFTVESDEGNGTVDIYKGLHTNWTEQELDDSNVPEIDVHLGAITKEYKIGNTEQVVLRASDLLAEQTTLVLRHQGGNDLAIASKEHPSKIGPKLIVSYNAPEDAATIVIEEEEPETSEEENASEEENTAPMAVADASPSGGQVPLEVTFTGSNSSDDKTIVSYHWDFKDGGTSTIANPIHSFTAVGTYDATLTVTDAEGLATTDVVTITANEESNAAPVARISASPLSGTTPLEVSFNGSNSTDDNSIASYSWDFKDGSSANNANPTHTFNTAGTFEVALTVTDENGLSDIETVTITVNEAVSNEAPVAIATANPMSGEAPLTVNFNGSSSSDDNGVSSYFWDIPGSPSAAANPIHTFNDPGVYQVILTVTDTNGLTDNSSLTITVLQPSGGSNMCITNGGKANSVGLKTWCWNDITIPEYTNGKGPRFANNDFVVDSECDPDAVSIENGRVKFNLVPRTPPTSNNSDCYRNYNVRAEIRTNPWDVKNPLGTEEWYGFKYVFGDDYKIHQNKHWYLFQVYPGPEGIGPQVHLQTSTEGQFNGNPAGELFFYRQPADNERVRQGTGIIPRAGDELDIVCHFIWGIGNQGLTQVWINGQLVFNQQGSNVKLSHPYGGNLKIGIYKSGWNNLSQIQADEANGISSLTTYLGNLRIITRRPGDTGYGEDSYSAVAPR